MDQPLITYEIITGKSSNMENHKKAFHCKDCNLDFETKTKLSNHKYDTHVNIAQVDFNDEKRYMFNLKRHKIDKEIRN